MPIFSYLAIPRPGTKEKLQVELASLDHCQVVAAENQEILILVTDTPDQQTEETLQTRLKDIQSLQSLSMSFGYDEKE